MRRVAIVFGMLAAVVSPATAQTAGWSLTPLAVASGPAEYRIGPLDKLNINVFQVLLRTVGILLTGKGAR